MAPNRCAEDGEAWQVSGAGGAGENTAGGGTGGGGVDWAASRGGIVSEDKIRITQDCSLESRYNLVVCNFNRFKNFKS